VSFVEGDLLRLPDVLGGSAPTFAAVLCRGVLNDLLDDESRRRAFAAFAGCLAWIIHGGT
jgi:hypothetical protein